MQSTGFKKIPEIVNGRIAMVGKFWEGWEVEPWFCNFGMLFVVWQTAVDRYTRGFCTNRYLCIPAIHGLAMGLGDCGRRFQLR